MTVTRPAARPDPDEQKYWDHVAAGELRLQRCECCGTYRYPPGPSCGECGDDRAHWTLLSGRGRVVAWTVFHRTYFPALPAPYTVISVATEEGPLLVGNLVGATAPPRIGSVVTAIFEDVHFENGSAGRICQWRSAEVETETKGDEA